MKRKTQIVAGWSFTKRCNLRCRHCYSKAGKCLDDELTLEEALKVADKLKESGVVAVNFGGGECCLRKDFIELCRYLNKLGIDISYTTNGTTFSLIKDHLDLFHDIGVSIDFADAETHDQFRGVPGSFKKAIATIKELVKEGVNTEIVTCLTKLNCHEEELERIYELSKVLNVNYWRLNRFRENGRGIANQSELSLSKINLKRAFSFLASKMNDSVSVPEPLFRSAFGGNYLLKGDPSGFTAFRIQPNGEVSPSVFLSESGGNIKHMSVKEIMDSPIFKRIRDRKPKGKCKRCPSYHHCQGGDAGASFLKYGHFNGPDPLCWIKPEDKLHEVKRSESGRWNVHEMYLCTVYIPIGKENKNA